MTDKNISMWKVEEFLIDNLKEIPMAFCIGNHDRKSVGYKYYTSAQNCKTRGGVF